MVKDPCYSLPLKAEKKVEIKSCSKKVTVELELGENVRLVNKKNGKIEIVRSEEKASHIEWMIRGQDIMRYLLCQIVLKYFPGLRNEFVDRLKKDYVKIEEEAGKLKNAEREDGKIAYEKNFAPGVKITIKWVAGIYRKLKLYPTVNVMFEINSSSVRKTKKGKYRITFCPEQVKELAYSLIYIISVSEICEEKSLETATWLFGNLGI